MHSHQQKAAFDGPQLAVFIADQGASRNHCIALKHHATGADGLRGAACTGVKLSKVTE
jgi:hypothetical protein